MKRLEKLLEAPKFLPKIPQGYHYAGVYRFKSLLSANQAEVAYIDERGNFAWAGPNNVQNKSENEFVHTIFQNK